VKAGILLTVGDPRTVAELAALAEANGWDGVFTWDGIAIGELDTYDPWVTSHASPEEAWRMFLALGAKYLLPIHHSTFRLSREPMDEPIRRLLAEIEQAAQDKEYNPHHCQSDHQHGDRRARAVTCPGDDGPMVHRSSSEIQSGPQTMRQTTAEAVCSRWRTPSAFCVSFWDQGLRWLKQRSDESCSVPAMSIGCSNILAN